MIHSSRSMSSINAAQGRSATPLRRPHANTVTERPMVIPLSPTPSPSRMLVSSPPHSPRNIQNHLYQMFLEGQTADVAVVIRGSWEALYNLHRVILIQSVCTLSPTRPALANARAGLLSLTVYKRLSRVVSQVSLRIWLYVSRRHRASFR